MLLQLESPTSKRTNHSVGSHTSDESYPPLKKQEKVLTNDPPVEKCAACQEPAYGFMVAFFFWWVTE